MEYLKAFFCGGALCLIGQILIDRTKLTPARILVAYVVMGVILGGIGVYGPYKAVNYHRWDVCKAAVVLGKAKDMPVYKFLREPLIRKFGEAWYNELEIAVGELKQQNYI